MVLGLELGGSNNAFSHTRGRGVEREGEKEGRERERGREG